MALLARAPYLLHITISTYRQGLTPLEGSTRQKVEYQPRHTRISNFWCASS